MKEHDKEKCMCDTCIRFRVARKVAEREQAAREAPYIKRRGGPPGSISLAEAKKERGQ